MCCPGPRERGGTELSSHCIVFIEKVALSDLFCLGPGRPRLSVALSVLQCTARQCGGGGCGCVAL